MHRVEIDVSLHYSTMRSTVKSHFTRSHYRESSTCSHGKHETDNGVGQDRKLTLSRDEGEKRDLSMRIDGRIDIFPWLGKWERWDNDSREVTPLEWEITLNERASQTVVHCLFFIRYKKDSCLDMFRRMPGLLLCEMQEGVNDSYTSSGFASHPYLLLLLVFILLSWDLSLDC